METTFFKAEIEITETWVIRRPRFYARGLCEQCGREVSLLAPEEAARLACLEMPAFYGLMENNRFHLHYIGSAAQPFVCLNSLCSVWSGHSGMFREILKSSVFSGKLEVSSFLAGRYHSRFWPGQPFAFEDFICAQASFNLLPEFWLFWNIWPTNYFHLALFV